MFYNSDHNIIRYIFGFNFDNLLFPNDNVIKAKSIRLYLHKNFRRIIFIQLYLHIFHSYISEVNSFFMFGFYRKVSRHIRRGFSASSRNIDADIGYRFSFLVGHLALELLQFPFLRKNIVCICNANTNDE